MPPIKPKPFQLTAARRRLDFEAYKRAEAVLVSTHSRPKAAGDFASVMCVSVGVSTHSRPKAAGCLLWIWVIRLEVSTHSRPKAAGAAWWNWCRPIPFQLTAARRRLGEELLKSVLVRYVSTHSRPKAAGYGFNGYWICGDWFQLTAARRRLGGNI